MVLKRLSYFALAVVFILFMPLFVALSFAADGSSLDVFGIFASIKAILDDASVSQLLTFLAAGFLGVLVHVIKDLVIEKTLPVHESGYVYTIWSYFFLERKMATLMMVVGLLSLAAVFFSTTPAPISFWAIFMGGAMAGYTSDSFFNKAAADTPAKLSA